MKTRTENKHDDAQKTGAVRDCPVSTGSVWQDISTAPRDGTKIIGWGNRLGAKEIYWEHGFVEAQTGIVLHHTNHPRFWVPSPNVESRHPETTKRDL